MARILCFMGEITVDFQSSLMQALSEKAVELGHNIEFFINFNTDRINAMHGEIERKIFCIPDISNYDYIILCLDTFAITGMSEEVANYFAKNAKCPVISVRENDERFYNILYEDKSSMAEMVEHFITVHHFTRIFFMTGLMYLDDSHRRLDGYLSVMKKHGLEVKSSMIFYGDYWRDKGDEAVEYFLSQNDELPQAIVCSNDYMAMAVCDSLQKRGIRVPEDVCISGLDGIEEALFHIPPISTIVASTERICKKVFELIDNFNNGIKCERTNRIPLEVCYRNSCGCQKEIDLSILQRLYIEKEHYYRSLYNCPYISLDFGGADNLPELFNIIGLVMTNRPWGCPENFGTIYVCLCDESERQDNLPEMAGQFTENVILSAAVTKDSIDLPDIVFKREKILPDGFRNDSSVLHVFNLHCKDFCYGYVVWQINDINPFKQLVKPIIFSICDAIDRIRIFSENQTIQDLREQSYLDELTQIPNRRYMEHFIRQLYEHLQSTGESFCIMSIDMDGLKYINDTFGHLEGDEAIKAIADIIYKITPSNGLASRTGGDEYCVLFPSESTLDAEKCIAEMQAQIKEYNRYSKKDYPLSVSVGYEYCRPNMDMLICVHEADKKMYEQKKQKKHNRIPKNIEDKV